VRLKEERGKLPNSARFYRLRHLINNYTSSTKCLIDVLRTGLRRQIYCHEYFHSDSRWWLPRFWQRSSRSIWQTTFGGFRLSYLLWILYGLSRTTINMSCVSDEALLADVSGPRSKVFALWLAVCCVTER